MITTNAKKFYDNLETLYNSHSFSPYRIWNCNELGIQEGGNDGHLLSSVEVHGTFILLCPTRPANMNAGGTTIPSFCIFGGKCFRQKYIPRCEPGPTMAIQEKAWMLHFIQSVERLGGISLERQHLFIMDGHTSHITLEVVEEAKLGRLDLLTLLSHTIQPLDCSIFNPFKEYFKAYRDYWQAQNLTKTTSKETLAHWILLA